MHKITVRILLLVSCLVLPPLYAAELSDNVLQYVSYESGDIAIEHALLIDGTGGEPVSGQTILLNGDRIVAVGDDGTVNIPDDATRIDATGKTLLPGFVMVHEHLFYPAAGLGYNHQGHSFPPLYLAGGLTTGRTAGGQYEDHKVRELINTGQLVGPKIILTGPHINGPGWAIWTISHDADDARRRVRIYADDGFEWSKAYMHLTEAQFDAIIDEAKETGTRVTGHLCSISYVEAAEKGIDNLEHGFFPMTDFVKDRVTGECPPGLSKKGMEAWMQYAPDSPEMQAIIKKLVNNGVALTSTNTIFETFAPGRPAPRGEVTAKIEPASRDSYYHRWSAISQSADSSLYDEALVHNMKLEYAFVQAGGLMAVGTDPTGYGGVIAGYSNQRALELLVEGGFTIPEAVQIATQNGALLLELEDSIGTVEAGKTADLILVDGNLAEDVEAIRNVELVFKDGYGYDSKKLFDSIDGTVGLH